jgi:hypothetical protein
MDSHPLSLDDSTSASGSSIIHHSDTAPPTFSSRNDVARGSSSSSQARPGYFDLQRLAAAHAEATNAAHRDRKPSVSYNASISIPSSSASSSRASEDGMEELDDSMDAQEDDEDEEIPRWLKSASNPPAHRRPPSRNSIASSKPHRNSNRDTIHGIPFRGNGPSSSQSSMRSPPPSSPAYKRLTAQTPQSSNSLFPPGELEVDEAHDGTNGDSTPSRQFLSSLHLMTDEELDRHLGMTPSTFSRPQLSSLQSQSSVKSDTLDLTKSRVLSSNGSTTAPSLQPDRPVHASSAGPKTSKGLGIATDDDASLRIRHKLLRDLSQQLRVLLKDSDASKRTFEQETDRLGSALHSQRKEFEARETALREILTSMGVSTARVDRALVQATSESHVPVFHAHEQLANYSRQSDHDTAAGKTQGRGTDEELLPASLREALSRVFEGH